MAADKCTKWNEFDARGWEFMLKNRDGWNDVDYLTDNRVYYFRFKRNRRWLLKKAR